MTLRAALFLAAAASLWPAGAHAQQVYRGLHPIDLDGHWHLEDAEHVHDGLVVGDGPFGVVDEVHVFLGDPLAYGYDGEVWTYTNAHPLPGGISGYCGITRTHRHPFAPEGSYERESRGVYRYTGGMRGGWAMTEPGRIEPARPVVVAPPAGSSAPVLWAGCMYGLTPGRRGGLLLAPLPGCASGSPATSGGGGSGARRGRASEGTYYDRTYRGHTNPGARSGQPRVRSSRN